MSILGLFSVYFVIFKQTLQFVQQTCEKCYVYGAEIRTHDHWRRVSSHNHLTRAPVVVLQSITCGMNEKVMLYCSQENMAVLYIFIKDPYYTLIMSDEKMSPIFFVANAAGLLGLCIGPSIVTFFEVFYHCFDYCFTKKRGRRRVNSDVMT